MSVYNALILIDTLFVIQPIPLELKPFDNNSSRNRKPGRALCLEEGYEMADRIFDNNGCATLIYDSDCLRSSHRQVIAWISGNSVYSLRGQHYGWFEYGVLYDRGNFTRGPSRNKLRRLWEKMIGKLYMGKPYGLMRGG